MLCFPPSTAAKSTCTRYQSTMLANILVTLVTVLPALAASLSSRAAPEGRSCGTQISKERVLEAERHFDANRVVSNSSSERAIIDIPVRFNYSSLSSWCENSALSRQVYWNAVYRDDSVGGGYIPQSQIDSQMSVLNDAFKFVGVSFKLQRIRRHRNADWFNSPRMGPGTTLQRDMKRALRQGRGANVLDLYSVG